MTLSTAVLDWSSNDNEDALSSPFKIVTDPETVIKGQPFSIKIYANDAPNWIVEKRGPLGGAVLNFTIEPGEAKTETTSLSGGSSVSSEFPVDTINANGIKTESGLLGNDSFSYLSTVGGVLGASDYNVINGSAELTFAEDAVGSVELDYNTTIHKNQRIAALDTGTYYYLCRVPGTDRKELLTFTFKDADAVAQTIEIRDYCTDEVIAGATVEIAGNSYTTDANGIVVLGEMDSGQTIPVRITAAGYHDSDVDTLNNDQITT